MPPIIWAAFGSSHPRVVDLASGSRPVVCCENKDRVVRESFLFEQLSQQANLMVDIGNHSKKVGDASPQLLVRLCVLWWRMHRAVCGIAGDVREKGIARFLLCSDERLGVVKKNIGAKPRDFEGLVVLQVGAIKVRVVPTIGSLSNATASVAQDLIETSVRGTKRIVVPQVPFTKHARRITVLLEDIRHRDFVFKENGPSIDGVPRSGSVGPMSR